MEGPFETAVPYDAPRDDADRWQAPIANVGALWDEVHTNLSAVSPIFAQQSMQQQPALHQLEQQQQMRRSEEPVEVPVQKSREQLQREYEKALAWVKVYEPDRLW